MTGCWSALSNGDVFRTHGLRFAKIVYLKPSLIWSFSNNLVILGPSNSRLDQPGVTDEKQPRFPERRLDLVGERSRGEAAGD